MKSATQVDVDEAKRTKTLREDVMYSCAGWKIHGKRMTDGVAKSDLTWIIAERDDGVLHYVHPEYLLPLSKGPSQQPKRSKHKPVKGTRPETLVPMSSDVKLKVGDKVVLSDGSRTKVVEVDDLDLAGHYFLGLAHGWFYPTGAKYSDYGADVYVTHKIILWTPPAPAYKPEDVAFNKTAKCAEELTFDEGYWVPHVAQLGTACPEWASGREIEVLLSGGIQTLSRTGLARVWDIRPLESHIIVAYRKAQ